MPLFKLRIIVPAVHRDVIVEARDLDEAADMSVSIASAVGSGSKVCNKVGFVCLAAQDSRISTYTCEFCNSQTLKELWGPGRITCPTCGKQARSAAERGEAT